MDSRVAEVFRSSLHISPYNNIYDFFKEGFNLTEDDRFARFDVKYSPWVKLLCEWFEDPEVDWIYLVFGSQTSKTTYMMGVLLYVTQYVRGAVPTMWVMSTEDEIKIFLKSRLKPFLGNLNLTGEKWKTQTFRLFNANFKASYASNKTTIRSMPCRFVFGDECGIWREPVSYLQKRTRTFAGKRKGVFATTPPENPDHHSWKEATNTNFYQWWVACPECEEYQPLLFKNLEWDGKNKNGTWDYEKVKDTTKYRCRECGCYWKEHEKLEIINSGKGVCVDPITYEQIEATKIGQKTLQISSLYSIFTKWGQLATDFLTAKQAGAEAFRIFLTDELAETSKEEAVIIKEHKLRALESERVKGFVEGYDFYTVGVDVQRKGELFWVLVGWKKGLIPSGHILDYNISQWKDEFNNTNWKGFLNKINPYLNRLYRVTLDSTDGLVAEDIIDFCVSMGTPFIPLKDRGSVPIKKIDFKKSVNYKKGINNRVLYINSSVVKDEIATAFERTSNSEGAWTFPKDTSIRFYQHLSNEVRINQKGKYKWIPKYANAPQHWFSALVYATVAKEDIRTLLVELGKDSLLNKKVVKKFIRKRGGFQVWQ